MDDERAPCDVLVVGAGPVGLTAALEMLRHGLSCRIVDCAPHATDKSKALVLWGRTMELLDRAGIADDFVSAGMFANGASFYGNGKRLAQIRIHRDDTAYPRPLMLPQSETERLLAARLLQAGLAIERSVELTELYDDGKHVSAMLRHADGRQENIVVPWLVGCDGAHSSVRKQLGISFSGECEPNDWILADVHLDGAVAKDELSIYWHSLGIVVFFPITPDRFRVIADLGKAPNTEKPADPTLAQVQAILDERGPGGIRVHSPVWLSGFRIHERKVSEYGKGRVFLAGDAAHIHSPAGGQGMNTGMQDAFNLAWKLALVQRGHAPEFPLLASYSQERSAVGDMVLRNAALMTKVATVRNPELQFIRNHLFSILGKLSVVQQRAIASLTEMDIHYPGSAINGEDAGNAWTDKIRPGGRLPDANLTVPGGGQPKRLHELIRGTKHSLLIFADEAHGDSMANQLNQLLQVFADFVQPIWIWPRELPEAASTRFKLAAAITAAIDDTGQLRERLGVRGAAIALVRPDGYLNYRGHAEAFGRLRSHLEGYLSIARVK